MNPTAVVKLDEYLQKARKHFEQWNEEQLRFLNHIKESHFTMSKDLQEKAVSLAQREKQLLETAEKISERLDSEKQEIEAVMAGISQLKSKQEMIPEKKTKLKEELENQSSLLKSRQRAFSEINETSQQKYANLRNAIRTYENCLGLRLERTEDGRIAFIFTHINQQVPEREYSFCIFVDENDHYQVESCTPPVKDITVLLEKLNRDEDLSRFILSIRKRFQAMVS
ncbi:Kinetochore protein spc25 [Galdieria sulphuraria]|uniref:Kinetochore protein SPC25 n=1 Tax=Galdieria sulphuraria TaxID=130081 RepID=M2Y0X4_GALSU|nr:uncharacterized protein Gasu_31060 [Galdieria sulphuraria]EME29464.1 kinetochore protein Spc25, animal type [Galdieria sulphuraria]GJD06022.1 Kinetochore protein spc25 [Galdieria sulphuraria]|eukprot:XP_005705984.1 kinetochore protein Spc25, animal type [Galdieria sulphuraria]